MSYIKCKSFITNKDVQYGLIDVKLKHNILQQVYGTVNTSSTTYWNTSPELTGTRKMAFNTDNNKYFTIDAMKMGMISGGKEQAYSASGMLDSEYLYVRSGKQPIISNRTFDIEEMNDGYNQFDLFETDNVKVILECLKTKASNLTVPELPNFSFREIDGSLTEDPYVIADCVIKQILKSSNTVIGEYSYIYNIKDEVFPIKFALNTEVFRIVDFDPSYYTATYYNDRYSLWLDDSCTQNNKLYNNGEFVSGKGDFIGITVSVFMSDYWYASRNNYDMKRRQITNTDGTIISNTLLRNFNNTAQNSLITHNINNNPNRFIIFGNPIVGASKFTTTQEALDIANSVINSENNYLTKGYNYSDTKVVFPWNFILSPIMAPLVTTDYQEISSGTSGVFIPLTNTVFEGDPVNPDDPDNPDEPETTEPADDPDTDYTTDVSDNYEDYNYPNTDIIPIDPGNVNGYRPSLSNYIFKRMRFTTVDHDWNKQVLTSILEDVNNISWNRLILALYDFVNSGIKAEDILSRIYVLPFEYDELINKYQSAGHAETTPYIAGIGTILNKYTYSQTEWLKQEPHYYDQLLNRFYEINLGEINVQKVFNNYLDYNTVYNLVLPYGAENVEIDPDFLFLNSQTGNIKIKGYLDIDTGILLIKVAVNNQLYYETSVNVACDVSIYGNDLGKIINKLSKMVMAGGGMMWTGTTGPSYKEMKIMAAEEERQIRYKLEQMNQRDAKKVADKEEADRIWHEHNEARKEAQMEINQHKEDLKSMRRQDEARIKEQTDIRRGEIKQAIFNNQAEQIRAYQAEQHQRFMERQEVLNKNKNKK